MKWIQKKGNPEKDTNLDGKYCVTRDQELFPANGDFRACTESFLRYDNSTLVGNFVQ